MHEQNTSAAADSLATRWLKNQRLLAVTGLVLVLCLIVAAWLLRDTINALEVAGYPGVFILNFVGAVSIVLPIPGLISACGLSVVLDPFILGCIIGVAESLGEWSGYLIGLGGHTFLDRYPRYRLARTVVERWMRRRGALLLLAVSIIPNPLFDLVGIAAGTVQYPFRRFMAVVFVGKVTKGLMVSYACHLGITWFTELPWL